MNRIGKLIQIVNLLHNRRYVTSQQIQKLCNVSKRTVYRYLNAISEANIPIRFSQQAGGYVIDQRDSLLLNDLGPEDAVLLLLALKALKQKLQGPYCERIQSLVKKIFVRSSFPIERVWDIVDSRDLNTLSKKELSQFVSSQLVYTSILTNRQLKLLVLNEPHGERTIRISRPVLHFNHHWVVRDSNTQSSEPFSLDKIIVASIE
jgi:predicted DNA-binding transcriptional regulator YafY